MIIDAHVHLPVGNEYIDMESKKKRLLLEMKNAGVDKCIAIADSWPESDIGSNSDLVDLFEDCGNVYVIGGISPFKCFSETLENLESCSSFFSVYKNFVSHIYSLVVYIFMYKKCVCACNITYQGFCVNSGL